MSDTSQGPEWWVASDGRWYPPETHPNRTALASDFTCRREPDTAEGGWQAIDEQWYPTVADNSVHNSVDDLGPSPEGNWSQQFAEDATHDFDDGNGPVSAHLHANGGGWVANTATVSRTAFVGLAAAVFGSSKVLGKATVTDRARVRGQSEVSGNARISGDAVIDGNARVTDEAEVSDSAIICGLATVFQNAQVGGYTKLSDREVVKGISRLAEAPEPQLVSCDNGHSVCSAANFCPVCGLPIAASPNFLRYCPGCGTESIPDTSFCAVCGRSLAIRGVSPTPGPLFPTTSEPPPPGVAVAIKRRNTLSVWSIVLVILLGSIGALVAIPMGFIARRQIRRSNGTQKGAGLALAAIIIGFVFVGITLAIIGLEVARSGTSGSSGPSLLGLTSSVKAQIAGNGSDSLKLTGVASVVCDPPKSWQPGETFTCIAYNSTGSEIGEYDGTVEPDSSPGKFQWNASWNPSG